MKIIIDKHIPFIKGVLEPFAEVEYLNANDITNDKVKDIDAIIVRTRTLCDETLLKDSSVKLIVSATIGYDHIDTIYCESNNITWKNAPGCNANSVRQYIESVIAQWVFDCKLPNVKGKTIAIIGVGNVGKCIVQMGEMLGMKILLYDPFRAKLEKDVQFSTIEDIVTNADIITFHTPLTFAGRYPTYHLGGQEFFNSLKRKPLIINAARGGVLDEKALKNAINNNLISYTAIDCWENEPNIDTELLSLANISTPHIAGYSADGKVNGTRMAIEAVCDFFNLNINTSLFSPLEDKQTVQCTMSNILKEFIKSYNITQDSTLLKSDHTLFENLRSNYPIRREVIYKFV